MKSVCVESLFLSLVAPWNAPLFPYTTLFRSVRRPVRTETLRRPPAVGGIALCFRGTRRAAWTRRGRPVLHHLALPRRRSGIRSEEHTSELQSRGHLVCRLLLEKKKLPRIRHI